MRMEGQAAFTIIGGISIKRHIRTASAIHLGWMEDHRLLVAHHGLLEVHNGHERHHGTDERISRMLARSLECLFFETHEYRWFARCLFTDMRVAFRFAYRE
jgi:hypothetical protein